MNSFNFMKVCMYSLSLGSYILLQYWMMQQLKLSQFFLSKCKRHVHIHIRICCVPMLLALPVCKMVTMVAMPCQAILCLMLFGIFFSSFLLLFECVSISFFCIKRRKYKLNQLRQYLKEHDHDFCHIYFFYYYFQSFK